MKETHGTSGQRNSFSLIDAGSCLRSLSILFFLANSQFRLSGYGHASKNEQCYEAQAYSVPAVGI